MPLAPYQINLLPVLIILLLALQFEAGYFLVDGERFLFEEGILLLYLHIIIINTHIQSLLRPFILSPPLQILSVPVGNVL